MGQVRCLPVSSGGGSLNIQHQERKIVPNSSCTNRKYYQIQLSLTEEFCKYISPQNICGDNFSVYSSKRLEQFATQNAILRNNVKQPGAELCQAQGKLRLVGLWLNLCLLTGLGFPNMGNELLLLKVLV